MARFARIIAPGFPHHVTQRGNRRQPVFFWKSQTRSEGSKEQLSHVSPEFPTEMLKSTMRNKILRYTLVYLGITMFVSASYLGRHSAAGGVMKEREDGQRKRFLNSHTNYESKSIQNKFTELHNQWQEYIRRPEVKISSRSQDYINCKPYKDIVALGHSALPYLIQKIKEGKNNSWNEGQFFLWYAAREISGVNLVKNDEKILNEQEVAERYLNWWGIRNSGDREKL